MYEKVAEEERTLRAASWAPRSTRRAASGSPSLGSLRVARARQLSVGTARGIEERTDRVDFSLRVSFCSSNVLLFLTALWTRRTAWCCKGGFNTRVSWVCSRYGRSQYAPCKPSRPSRAPVGRGRRRHQAGACGAWRREAVRGRGELRVGQGGSESAYVFALVVRVAFPGCGRHCWRVSLEGQTQMRTRSARDPCSRWKAAQPCHRLSLARLHALTRSKPASAPSKERPSPSPLGPLSPPLPTDPGSHSTTAAPSRPAL